MHVTANALRPRHGRTAIFHYRSCVLYDVFKIVAILLLLILVVVSLAIMLYSDLFCLGAVFSGLATLVAANPTPLDPPVVDLGYSIYQGTTLGSGINQYLGIRYAAPPLGDLRFRAPAEPLSTSGIQTATAVRFHFLP
jgi:hypothetical protein